ncbi:GntR family transcriptional regulator [Demequina rhizosphaerae]|uniref:GntR family transcriptional regulator n=1 Tax=Demequina rhizosphaerae TaxID=1638985 RepID=UPI0007833355|nr:GntR family transcriptional regulator [Demequina rhizosphaerae]
MTPESKADHAYRILTDRLAEGVYLPGHRLVIDRLVREHGISSIPWREALRRLEAEGWVDIIPNAGAVVRAFTTDDQLSTMRVLGRLEPLAIALSAPHLDAGEIAAARELEDQAQAALVDFDAAGFAMLDRAFHSLLRAHCPDARLTAMVDAESLRLAMMDRVLPAHAPGRVAATPKEHADLLALIESGACADEVEEAARAHRLRTVAAIEAAVTAG